LALVGLLCAWVAAPAGAADAEDDDRQDDALDQRFAVNPDVRVELEILSGRIDVRGTDASEVRIVADGGGGYELTGSRRRVKLRAPGTGWFPWSRGVGVDLSVEVPRGARVKAQTVNGPISVVGVLGELELHAANGEIEVKGSPREAFLETLNASIRFEGEGGSEVVARTLNGEIDLRGVSGDVEATAVSGKIRVQGEALERAELRTMSGSIDLDASLTERARVEARTYSGGVRLRLPADTSARFDVKSHSGGVSSGFVAQLEDGDDRTAWTHDPGGRLDFSVGGGDGRISVESFSGGVSIERRDAEASDDQASDDQASDDQASDD
jgi:hypothetical protein